MTLYVRTVLLFPFFEFTIINSKLPSHIAYCPHDSIFTNGKTMRRKSQTCETVCSVCDLRRSHCLHRYTAIPISHQNESRDHRGIGTDENWIITKVPPSTFKIRAYNYIIVLDKNILTQWCNCQRRHLLIIIKLACLWFEVHHWINQNPL